MNTPTQDTEHAPGPWQYFHRNGSWHIAESGIPKAIASIHWRTTGQNFERAKANAALIARAPALLADNQRLREQVAQLTEALKHATYYMERDSDDEQERQDAAEAWKALSAVERGQK